ncbi:MAG: MBL fold metallo-hydrolase [Pseudomonadota bacterium]
MAGRFQNAKPMHRAGLVEQAAIMWKFFFAKPARSVPAGSIPVRALTRAQLVAAPDNSVFRLGHSSLLLKMNHEFWLTDPVFSERASPLQWAGPARFHQSPISIADLPPIKGVILSHDHYDHLDHAAIVQLAAKTEHFLTPLGVGDTLIRWGVHPAKVRQLDWLESTTVGQLRLVATPAQHFSGRGLNDANATLWASWVIEHRDVRVFFSGDSGYFDGFKAIGEQFGPFDLTMIETGAYDKHWPDVHMQPEQTLQAHLDLRGKCLMPIHNGTFDLGLHVWHEPFDRIAALAKARGVPLATPEMGQALSLTAPQAGEHWWLKVDGPVPAQPHACVQALAR